MMNKYDTKEHKEKLERFCDETLHEKIPEPQMVTEFELEIAELSKTEKCARCRYDYLSGLLIRPCAICAAKSVETAFGLDED